MPSDWVLKFEKKILSQIQILNQMRIKASKGFIPKQAREVATGESRISYWRV